MGVGTEHTGHTIDAPLWEGKRQWRKDMAEQTAESVASKSTANEVNRFPLKIFLN
jgi:hypothetical protein